MCNSELLFAVNYHMKKIFIYGDENILVNYKNALTAVGAQAVFSTDVRIARDCDGLLLAGGGDISPCFYRSREKNCRSISLVRDISEQYLLALFERKNAPVMGVCRGLQMINVYFGGTLSQRIEKHYIHFNDKRDTYHEITNKAGFMRDIFGKKVMVNSCHRQKLELCGKKVTPCAFSDDGVAEAAFVKNTKIFGVQFHPERPFLNGSNSGLKLYDYFLSLF